MASSGISALKGPARTVASAALLCWLMCACAVVWEWLALQSPDSPYHVGVLAGPVGQLRAACFMYGTGLLASAFLWPTAFGSGGRYWVVLALTGVAISVAALAVAARLGMWGIHVVDPRPSSLWLLGVRVVGHLLVVGALIDLGVRVALGRGAAGS